MPWGSAAATSSGAYTNGQPALEVGGFYSHQPPAGALGGAAARRGTAPYTPVYAGGAYYTAAVRFSHGPHVNAPMCSQAAASQRCSSWTFLHGSAIIGAQLCLEVTH